MRIVVDLQGCQTSTSKDRGIGRYSLALAQAMARNAGDHEIWLALNGDLKDTVDQVRSQFSGLVPPDRIRAFDASPRVAGMRIPKPVPKGLRRRVQELRREAFLTSLEPDFVHLSSLFEGGEAVTSVGRQGSTASQAITLYDLIPLLNPRMHLKTRGLRAWYRRKLRSAKRADLLLAISESSRLEAIEALHISDERVVNISSAVDPIFRPVQLAAAKENQLRARYGLGGRFMMYTGGLDRRKNVDGLIAAYAALPPELRQTHQLMVVCAMDEKDRIRLGSAVKHHGLNGNDVIFPGFIPEDDLVALYNLCTLFVFPSLHEGFGLPILEAMGCGAPAIGANNSSIPEVIGLDEALFDASCTESITAKMAEVLRDSALRQALSSHGLKQAATFSWDRSAIKALTAMETVRSRLPQG